MYVRGHTTLKELKHKRFCEADGNKKLKVLIPGAHYTFCPAKFGLKCRSSRSADVIVGCQHRLKNDSALVLYSFIWGEIMMYLSPCLVDTSW